MRFYAALLFFISRHLLRRTLAYTLNQTGGSFPDRIYQISTFSDGFVVPSDSLTYFGPSSSVGKCNIMGYWHTGNTDRSGNLIPTKTKARDKIMCTDTCTLASCGYVPTTTGSITIAGKTYDGLPVRNDAGSRLPLSDIGATDGNLSPADYFNFPDLQMLPALAGAVVPLYNIPEFDRLNITQSLILSRSSLVNIFMGFITSWNDPLLIADNAMSPSIQAALRTIQAPINIAVRTDSSGTSEVFTAALGAMSPYGYGIGPTGLSPSTDTSFYSQASPNGPTPVPSWCGPLTDELQYINITGCDSTLSAPSRSFVLNMPNSIFTPTNITLLCDASDTEIRSTILAATAIDVHVAVKSLSVEGGSSDRQIWLGYWGMDQQGMNMNKPIILSHAAELSTSIKALQEGGYLNTVTTCTSLYSTSQIMSLWILSGRSFSFSLSWTASGTMRTTSSLSVTPGTDMSASILAAFNTVSNGSVANITKATHPVWTEYRIIFTVGTKSSFNSLTSVGTAGTAYVTEYLAYNNYPCFYDRKSARLDKSGKYTCYRRQQNFVAWNYYTGVSNFGLAAEVQSRPYTIGYTVLEALQGQNEGLHMASLINRAGNIVKASSDTVGYAVMNLGGNFNSLMQANLADGSASFAWPISGYTYFIIRKNHHLVPGDCNRRKAAMEYLYRFYTSNSVKTAAKSIGFSTIPDFLANTIVNHLINNAMCMSGEYALSAYRATPSRILGTSVFRAIAKDYLDSYTSVDPSANMVFMSSASSFTLWESFAADPGATSGIFTMFANAKSKLTHYNINGVITSAFAHIALLPAYRLSYYESRTNIPLQVTPEIIGGLMSGAISMWNDTLIQAANPLTKSYLPHIPVVLIVRSTACDANELLIPYLIHSSPTFKKRYAATNVTVVSKLNFSLLIPPSRLLIAESNTGVDAFVATGDGTFGYYWLKARVNTLSSIANFCHDPVCSTGAIDPRKEASVLACQTTASVINPTKYLHTYDLTTSVAAGCYPIAGTVDYSILGTTNPLTCGSNGTAIATVLRNRIKFSSWIFSSQLLVKPLAFNNVYASSAAHRASTHTTICDIECDGSAYGYKYCGYQDCMWSKGDFVQTIYQCDPESQTISVTYSLKPDRVCILNPRTAPVSGTEIPCSDVLMSYRYGKIASALAVLGMSVTGIVMIFVYLLRHEKVIKKSQPIFIYIFIAGAFLMNLSIFAFIGPNTHSSCLLRPWCVNITSTIMFAPLLAKLHRIDMLYRSSKKMKKTKISDLAVALQVFGLLLVDVIILLLWTYIQRPRVVHTMYYAKYLEVNVDVNLCSTGLNSPFEQLMVIWKSMLLIAGVYKSICNWDKPSDIAEVKHFFLAIYNVSVVGGAMYFFSLFAPEPRVSMILRCIGLFVSATLPVLIIIFPKFTVIQFKTFSRKTFYMGNNRGSSNESLSNVSKALVASLFNFRSHSMKVLPDAHTPEFNNSSPECDTPSNHLVVDTDTPPINTSTFSPPRF